MCLHSPTRSYITFEKNVGLGMKEFSCCLFVLFSLFSFFFYQFFMWELSMETEVIIWSYAVCRLEYEMENCLFQILFYIRFVCNALFNVCVYIASPYHLQTFSDAFEWSYVRWFSLTITPDSWREPFCTWSQYAEWLLHARCDLIYNFCFVTVIDILFTPRLSRCSE